MKKILLIAPLPTPLTGESFANQTIYDNISKYSQYNIDSINTSYAKLENIGKLSFHKVFFYTKLYKKIFKILSADVVYISSGQTFFGVVKYAPFIYLTKILKKQLITHIHGNYLHIEYENAPIWKKKIMKSILSKSDKGIVLSSYIKNNLTPFISEKRIYVLANFVEDSLFQDNNIPHTDSLRVLFLSNLMPEKGIYDLLDALLILQEKNINFTAQFAGRIADEYREIIERKISNLRNSRYIGIIHGEAKKKAFLESNIFVLPSCLMEGQPISILEAMATGNIILTTSHPGIMDIVEEGVNGHYIDKNSPENIAKKLIEISNNLASYKEIMINNHKIAAEKYKVETFIKNFIKILES